MYEVFIECLQVILVKYVATCPPHLPTLWSKISIHKIRAAIAGIESEL